MKILVPIDFSDYSVNAFQYALALAKDIDAEITLFHAAHKSLVSDLNSIITIDDILLKESNEKLEALILEHKTNNIKTSYISEIGLANDVIQNLTSKLNIDLIIMGTKGATGITKVLLGSITSSLIKKSKTPILAVPINAKYTSIKNITLALDLKDNYSSNLNLIKLIASTKNAEIDILNIKTYEEKALIENDSITSIEETLKYIKHSYVFIEKNKISQTIKEFTLLNKTDLLAVISKQYSYIERLFHKSVSESLLLNLTTPLLVIKE